MRKCGNHAQNTRALRRKKIRRGGTHMREAITSTTHSRGVKEVIAIIRKAVTLVLR